MIPTFKIFLRTEYIKKDGSVPVYLRVVINRKKKDYSLGVSIWDPEKYWDASQNRVKRCTFINKSHVNGTIEDAETKAGDVIRELRKNHSLTISAFDKLFKNPVEIKDSFYSFASIEVENLKQMKASKETIRGYNSYISKLKQYKPELSFGEITLDFIGDYHKWMVNKGNKINTVHKSLSFIRTIIRKAIKKGIITDTVFKSYPLHKEPGRRECLTIDELNKIEKLYSLGTLAGYKANICKYFLFSCYTGARYQDVKNLRFVDLKKEIHQGKEQTIVKITMHKTKDPVSIPLITKALLLIGDGFEQQKVFRVATNQVTNRYLKDVITAAGVDKKVSFHCARHTFATISMTLGIPVEVISQLLGHHDLKTTMIYAKIVDDLKIQHLDKWNRIEHKPL